MRVLMAEVIAHIHECPECGAKWECDEGNYQDECPYPTKILCTLCWAKAPESGGRSEKSNGEWPLGAKAPNS